MEKKSLTLTCLWRTEILELIFTDLKNPCRKAKGHVAAPAGVHKRLIHTYTPHIETSRIRQLSGLMLGQFADSITGSLTG